MAETIYFDHAAMTPPLPCALEAYKAAPFGNPSSEHAIGQAARDALEQAREKIAALMDCEPEEVYFTSTATEAAAWVMNSLAESLYDVVASPYEHHAVSENINNAWQNDLPPYGTAICQMHSNNETGEIIPYPADKLKNGELFVCDATSSVGHAPVSFRGFGCDCLIADGIKFGSVPGAAFLIAKKGTPLHPMIAGGGQERGMRSGTENLPAICAMAAALEWQKAHMDENIQKIGAMRSMLFYALSRIPDHKWNTPFVAPCLPHILNISFDGVDAHALALVLSNEGVMVSPGAACSNGKNEPSHVIMAMYGDEERARGAIRISLSHENTPDECAEAARKIAEAVAYLRGIG